MGIVSTASFNFSPSFSGTAKYSGPSRRAGRSAQERTGGQQEGSTGQESRRIEQAQKQAPKKHPENRHPSFRKNTLVFTFAQGAEFSL